MTDVGLITIRELLRDPQYKSYFTKVPKLPDHYTPELLPWRLLVQKQGETKWRSKRFGTYKEAFLGFKKMLPSITNASINCPGLNFSPPIRHVRLKSSGAVKSLVWKPKLEAGMGDHHWCGYCRRPSIFVNKGMPAQMLNGFRLPPTAAALRCCICGSRADLMDIRQPINNQQWDTARPRLIAA